MGPLFTRCSGGGSDNRSQFACFGPKAYRQCSANSVNKVEHRGKER